MRLRVSVSGVECLSGQIECLILEYGLPLNVCDRAAYCHDKSEQPGSNQVTDRPRICEEEQVENAACKVQGDGGDRRAKHNVIKEDCPKRALRNERNRECGDEVVESN